MPDLILKPAAQSGNKIIIQDQAGGAVITTADSGATIASGVTGGAGLSGMTSLGTVTAGTISTGATIATGVHGKYVLEDFDEFYYPTSTSTSTQPQDALNISGTHYVTVTTGANTADLLEFICDYGPVYCNASGSGYIGYGLQRSGATNFGSPTTLWRSGRHTFGGAGAVMNDRYGGEQVSHKIQTLTDWGVSASTTYYVRLIGMIYQQAGSYGFGVETTNHVDGKGVRLSYRKWRLL